MWLALGYAESSLLEPRGFVINVNVLVCFY